MIEKPYLPPFKRWTLENFPFIEDDFDAITNYQLYCKIVEYIKSVDTYMQDVDSFLTEVENYFNNLDVQDEINNKLDEMSSDGTLEEIMASYLNTKAIFAFDSVSDMKEATNLINGSYVETYGFYSKSDLGGAKYFIRNIINTDIIDEITKISLQDENLIAVLVIENSMNVKQFGAKGDGTTDDTTYIQSCLDNVKNINVPDGTYMIDASIGLKPKSFTKIIMNKNSIFKVITNNLENYTLLRLYNIHNFEIDGGIIEGDKETHTGATGEWGHCVRIKDSSYNIKISNMILKNAWGDGLDIGDSHDITTFNNIYDSNRRQGISIGSSSKFYSINDKCINTGGTAPGCGVDIEPNNSAEIIRDITFQNLYTENNEGPGLGIWLMNCTDATNPVRINIINHVDKGSFRGLRISKPPMTTGYIKIVNSTYINNTGNGIIGDYLYNSPCKVEIINPTIINANANGTDADDSPNHKCCVQLTDSRTNQYTSNPLGGLYIINPYLHQKINNMYINPIFIRNLNNASTGIEDVKIINPLYLSQNHPYILNVKDLQFTDEMNCTKNDVDENWSIRDTRVQLLNTNTSWTAQRTITVKTSCPINTKIKFRGENATYPLKLAFESGCSVFGFGNTSLSSPTFNISKGGELEMIKINDTDYIVSINNSDLITTN